MIKVDARGEQCPIPVIKAKKALESAKKGDLVVVFVDNEIAHGVHGLACALAHVTCLAMAVHHFAADSRHGHSGQHPHADAFCHIHRLVHHLLKPPNRENPFDKP